jgi:tRNA(Arg) A34 adenosine deaminase TadA
MRLAIAESLKGMHAGEGGPFGCVIVREGELVSKGHNRVISTNDPTAHAEVVALRRAARRLGRFDLSDCVLYASCEPCPMCLSAIYWARIRKVFFANTKRDAAKIGFADQFIYEELELPLERRKLQMVPLLRNEALGAFVDWSRKADRVNY